MQSNPYTTFHAAFQAIQSTAEAILGALARPPKLISQISASRRQAERNYNSMSRSTRWPLGLLDDTRQRMNDEREERARQSEREGENLSKELRYTQQTVAGELAGWEEMHERMGRRAIRDLARGVLVQERMRLEGMRRALRRVQQPSRSGDGGEGEHARTAPVIATRHGLEPGRGGGRGEISREGHDDATAAGR